jgi:tetratricopeptide (TPR) repeat protein
LRSHLVADYIGMAASMRLLGDPGKALAMQTQSVEILRELSRNEPNSVSLREYLAEAVNKVGSLQCDLGKFDDALIWQREAHQIFKDLLAADANNSLARGNMAFADNGIADTLVRSGQPEAAINVLQESLAIFRAMSPESSSNRYVRSGFASANGMMGNACSALAGSRHLSRAQAAEKWREARSWYQKSLAVWIDKSKRGELENEEHDDQQHVLTQIARCDAELHQSASRSQH